MNTTRELIDMHQKEAARYYALARCDTLMVLEFQAIAACHAFLARSYMGIE